MYLLYLEAQTHTQYAGWQRVFCTQVEVLVWKQVLSHTLSITHTVKLTVGVSVMSLISEIICSCTGGGVKVLYLKRTLAHHMY